MKSTQPLSCPVCLTYDGGSLNMARHMVQSDRPGGPHQEWLVEALDRRFGEYAFKNDRLIAKLFALVLKAGRTLPTDPTIFRSWFEKGDKRQSAAGNARPLGIRL